MNDQLEITSRERPTFTRREFVAGAAGAMAVSLIPAVARAGAGKPSTGDIPMSRGYIKTKDGVDIFYKDWGPKSAQSSEDPTTALQSLLRNSYAVFCLIYTKSL